MARVALVTGCSTGGIGFAMYVVSWYLANYIANISKLRRAR